MSINNIAVVSGESLGDYHFGQDHPFGPHRLDAFLKAMAEQGLDRQVDWLAPQSCELHQLLGFHVPEYIEQVRLASKLGEGYIDYGDTPARPGIFEAATTVVGSVLSMIDRVMAGDYRRGFVPIAGLHHAYRDRCSGFCVFNDVAIAYQELRARHGLTRVLYVDIDAHHGDGVYYSFEDDPGLYVVDFHEDGRFLYPGTGGADEFGTGRARGHKLNFPLPLFADDTALNRYWPEVEAFIHAAKPEFILLQCGADSMRGDPITHLHLSEKSFYFVTQRLCNLADDMCRGRLVALGGGGYNMDNIARAWTAVIKAMLANQGPEF